MWRTFENKNDLWYCIEAQRSSERRTVKVVMDRRAQSAGCQEEIFQGVIGRDGGNVARKASAVPKAPGPLSRPVIEKPSA